MLLRVRPVHLPADAFRKKIKAASDSHPERSMDLLIGATTQPGKAAAAMAGALRPMGGSHGKYPLIRGIGTAAVHRALVSARLAQTYLDNDGRGVRFLVVPSFEQEPSTQTGSGYQNQLVMRLVRWKGTDDGTTKE